WTAQVWISFLISLAMTAGGIAFLPADPWVKGYLVMGTLFTVGSTFTLAKTTRDNHEAAKLRNRITSAKADKLLKEFELSEAA
nr:hypothetical protein [Deltaproteobacteria bacterium]